VRALPIQLAIGNWKLAMEDFLSRLIGKKLDIYCGGASSLRGEVLKVEMGVLHLRDADGKNCYVAVDKIVVVWEARDDGPRAGFVPAPPAK
jgi:hypothetical protein